MNKCHDCGVPPGELHVIGCDTERCPACGGQFISCPCDQEDVEHYEMLPWTGIFPGTEECLALGWVNKWDEETERYVPCEANDPDAGPDLNRLEASRLGHQAGPHWDPEKRCYTHDNGEPVLRPRR